MNVQFAYNKTNGELSADATEMALYTKILITLILIISQISRINSNNL